MHDKYTYRYKTCMNETISLDWSGLQYEVSCQQDTSCVMQGKMLFRLRSSILAAVPRVATWWNCCCVPLWLGSSQPTPSPLPVHVMLLCRLSRIMLLFANNTNNNKDVHLLFPIFKWNLISSNVMSYLALNFKFLSKWNVVEFTVARPRLKCFMVFVSTLEEPP